MFYKDEQVSDILLCKKCAKILDDPRLLPCGESASNKFISPMFDSEEKILNCEFCLLFHVVPKNGFASPKILEIF